MQANSGHAADTLFLCARWRHLGAAAVSVECDGIETFARHLTAIQSQFHAPTQRREGRECVSHDCGAVRICACHGFEQGNVQGRYCKP
jgi:hypothetical protein